MSNEKLFPILFSPFKIGKHTIPNRIVFTGHDTCLPENGVVNDALIAYLEKRARHGTGLIVLQVSGVHETARYTSHLLMANQDDCIPGYQRLAEACQRHGSVLFAQLLHPGREIMETADGLKPVSYSASNSPQERFRVMPRALNQSMINEIVTSFGDAARRMHQAGIQGVEILASHGYLPAQFLNPKVNSRNDKYGGSFANRIRFLEEIIDEVRTQVGDELAIGIRISCDERDEDGMSKEDAIEALKYLENKLDYASVVAGTSASLGGAVHIVPPMMYDNAYLKSESLELRAGLSLPIILTGRINQPHEAEEVIRSGADNIGTALQPRRVAVIGGGPAGMKAAVIADARGHKVTLYEASSRLGGQANLAQLLPHRAEFGGLVTNLQEELKRSQVEVLTQQNVKPEELLEAGYERVLIATGARPYNPPLERMGSLPVSQAIDLLNAVSLPGGHVVVYDSKGDWIGVGIAEILAKSGARVTLAVNGLHVGESLQSYVRDHTAARIHNLGIKVITYARAFGIDDDTVYFHHTAGGEPMIIDDVDNLVLCCGSVPNVSSEDEDRWLNLPVTLLGDCLAPRTAEEAVYDGLKYAMDI